MESLTKIIKLRANAEKAKIYQRFFKTDKGEYGEGDIFLGLTVPQSREIAKQFINLKLEKISKHLNSRYHEERLIALLILVEKYKKEKSPEIINFYLKNSKQINNWDLVDLTADKILGQHLLSKDKSTIYKLAKSDNLWERRIAIISTFAFIRNNKFEDTLKLSKTLLKDEQDLIHKAVGWMLREIGKRNQDVLEEFLKKNYKQMPRTMLRYAIEKFPENQRQKYLKGEV